MEGVCETSMKRHVGLCPERHKHLSYSELLYDSKVLKVQLSTSGKQDSYRWHKYLTKKIIPRPLSKSQFLR